MGRKYTKRLKFLICGSTLVFLLFEFEGFSGLFDRQPAAQIGYQTLRYPYPREFDVSKTNDLNPAPKDLQNQHRDSNDLGSLVDLNKSRIFILGKKTVYRLGEEIKLRIILHDGEGRRRRKGGDLIKVRIFEDRLNASATGHVIDHGTGSYTATLICLWVGYPTIQVYLYYTREMPGIMEGILQSVPTLRSTLAVFKNNKTTKCQPIKRWLNGSRPICNLTERNGGMSWYCEKPGKGDYSCKDLQFFRKGSLNPFLTLQKFYSKSARGCFNQTFHIRVQSSDTGKGICLENCGMNQVKSEGANGSRPKCSKFNRAKLWNFKSPTGFYYHDKWYMLHCKQPSLNDMNSALKHKHLVLYGDSTVRQWFVELKDRFECKFTTEEWTDKKWKLDSTAYCSKYNLTIDLVFHAFPGNIGERRTKIHSIARHLGNFHNKKDVIFLIFIRNHFNVYHKEVFLDRIKKIRDSVGRLLKANLSAKVFIKSSHVYWSMFDYKTEVYRRIVEEAFADISDKVIYLDNEDLTTAKVVKDPHPEPVVVRGMVDQLLAYIP